ncbi:MAG: phage tail tape measure protein, partial [Planctomycetota bacterium]
MSISIGDAVLYFKGDLSNLNQAADAAQTKIQSSMQAMTSATQTLGIGFAAVGAAVVGGMGLAVKAAADFEQTLKNAVSVTGQTGAAAADMEAKMSKLAITLGQQTAFSATEVAEAFYDLNSKGFDAASMSVEQLLPFLDLASATQSNLTDATEIVTSTLRGFGMTNSDTTRISDVLTKAIGLSAANMSKFGESMPIVSATAKAVGVSFEEVSASLGVLYDAGIQASVSATGMRNIMLDLTNGSPLLDKALQKNGLTLADLDIKNRGVAGALRVMMDAGMSATDIMAAFGDRNGTVAATLATNSEKVKQFTGELTEHAAGVARATAAMQLDTLSGQLQIMWGSLETVAISFGKVLIPALTDTVSVITPVLNAIVDFTGAWPNLTTAILVGVGVLGTLSLTLGVTLLAVKPLITTWRALHTLWVAGPKIMAAVSSGFTVITTAASTVVSGIGSIMTSGALLAAAPWIIGIGAIAIALGAIVISAYKTKQAFDELAVTQTNLDAKEKEYVESLKAHGVEIDANSLKNKDYNERLLVYHEAEKTSQDVVFRAAFEHYAKRAETEQEFAQGRNLRLNENINAEQAAFIVKQGYSAEYLRQILMYDKEKVDKLLESLGYEKESMIDTTKIAGALAEAYGMVATSAEAAAAVLERFAKLPPEIHEKITDLTEDYAEKLTDAAEKTTEAFAKAALDVQDIEEDWAYAQQEMFQAHSQNIDDLAGDLGRTLDDLYQSFFEKQIETYNSMYQLEQDFRDKSIDRAQEYRDDSVDLASDTAKKKKALQEKIDAEEDEEKKKKLEKELKDLETETAYKQSIITREYKEEQARAARDLARAEERLQAKLAAQEQAFQQELAKEYERNQRRAEEEQRRYDDSLEKAQYAIDERLEKEQRKEDEISRREQKMLDDIYDWYVKSYDKILEKTELTYDGITEAQNESNIAMTESFEDYINHSLDWLTYQTDTTEVESGKQEKAGV